MSESVITFILFALVVPLVVLPWVHRQYRLFGRLRGWSAFVAAGGILYGCGLVAFTLFPLPVVTPDFCPDRRLVDDWQLTPFASLDDILRDGSPALWQVLLNVVLFVPLGYLLRYRFHRGLPTSTAIGLATSLCIEITQGTAVFGLYPCPYRLADVDDLMTNTAGAVLGWLAARLTGRRLPPSTADPTDDTAPPGLPRRGLAFAGDLLVISLTQFTCQVALILAGGRLRDLATTDWFSPTSGAAVLVTCALVVPLLRADRATPGQVVFHLAVLDPADNPAPRHAIVLRFAAWWLPVLLLTTTGHTGPVFVLAALVALLARLRADRRTLLGLVSRTHTTTRATYLARITADR
ncbi:glycopeptide antibiotics resistance protein [Saccharothrix tamanrassetensis]|uniref:Glycopeptide antibiotics resistance protein n=1 Tax=Saccharothrix tamanrassetensis TaxID=1051531 RepID=A0A841CKR9_9PSEU|nr:VanZ family protein [Saccharothrix tamanrassetensis]MBB5956964.1 glycopeptide antibiotics resistance protein [Saccharothrix tamanrassetensis]